LIRSITIFAIFVTGHIHAAEAKKVPNFEFQKFKMEKRFRLCNTPDFIGLISDTDSS